MQLEGRMKRVGRLLLAVMALALPGYAGAMSVALEVPFIIAGGGPISGAGHERALFVDAGHAVTSGHEPVWFTTRHELADWIDRSASGRLEDWGLQKYPWPDHPPPGLFDFDEAGQASFRPPPGLLRNSAQGRVLINFSGGNAGEGWQPFEGEALAVPAPPPLLVYAAGLLGLLVVIRRRKA